MFRFHRTADMLSDVSRLLAFAADELRDCARAASVADDRACAAIDQADMQQPLSSAAETMLREDI